MKAIESYNNLCVTIDTNKNLIDNYNQQKKYYLKLLESRKPKDISGQAYDDMPKGSQNALEVIRIVEAIQEIDNHIFLLTEALQIAEKGKQETEQMLSRLTGLESEVYRMHAINGMTLKEVADTLKHDYDYIREINCKVKKYTI